MGCCLSTPSEGGRGGGGGFSSSASAPAAKPAPERRGAAKAREETWSRTGVVGLREQGLVELPASVARLGAAARTLDAAQNRIASLPPGLLGQLGALTRLVLDRNALAALPPDVGALAALKVLSVADNRLAALPPELGRCAKLEKVVVAGNALRGLPPELGQLGALSVLDVSRNELASLPASIGACGRLTELVASDNCLSAAGLPESLGQLAALRALKLDRNFVGAVPQTLFTGCVLLATLSLHGNPVSVDAIQQVPGFPEFEKRVQAKHGKRIATGVMIGAGGLDDGLDHETTRIIVPHT